MKCLKATQVHLNTYTVAEKVVHIIQTRQLKYSKSTFRENEKL